MTPRVAIVRLEPERTDTTLAEITAGLDAELIAFVNPSGVPPDGWPDLLVDVMDDESIVACGGGLKLTAGNRFSEEAMRFVDATPFLSVPFTARRAGPCGTPSLQNVVVRRDALSAALAEKGWLATTDAAELCAVLQRNGGRTWIEPRAAISLAAPATPQELVQFLAGEFRTQKLAGRFARANRPAQILAIYFIAIGTALLLLAIVYPLIAALGAMAVIMATWGYFFARTGRSVESLRHVGRFIRALWMNAKG